MKTSKNKALLPVYVRGLATGKYSLRQASESTGYTIHWLCKLKKMYLEQGPSIFENKNKGRVAWNRFDERERSRIAGIYADRYKDVNFSYFRECLLEEGINISYPPLASILKDYGQVSPERRKTKKKQVHRPRVRRECEGDMIQIDGTPYAWFYKFDNYKKFCMTGSIDDATGKITGLYLTENECLYGYLEVLRQTASNFGIPREVYSDRAAIFCYTPRDKRLAAWERLEVLHEKRTQWQRILEELNINQILAWSPEAKGRVERMWRTIQGQFPQWLYNRKISTVEEANKRIGEYVAWFNKKYAKAPAVDDPFWLEPPADLDDILCAQFDRVVSKDGCVNFQNTIFYAPGANLYGVKATICISERGMFLKYKGLYHRLVPLGGQIQEIECDNYRLPTVVVNIVHRYLYAFAKEISA